MKRKRLLPLRKPLQLLREERSLNEQPPTP
jgi:hypothetical protein